MPMARRRLIIDHHRTQIPRHSINRGRSGFGPSANANPERTYYIVPPGMNVIFRDEHGNELKR
jgi:hypothetical protein